MMNITMSYCIRQIIVRFLWDPNKGKRIITKEYFDLIWSSYAIIITEILEIDRVVLPKSQYVGQLYFNRKSSLLY